MYIYVYLSKSLFVSVRAWVWVCVWECDNNNGSLTPAQLWMFSISVPLPLPLPLAPTTNHLSPPCSILLISQIKYKLQFAIHVTGSRFANWFQLYFGLLPLVKCPIVVRMCVLVVLFNSRWVQHFFVVLLPSLLRTTPPTPPPRKLRTLLLACLLRCVLSSAPLLCFCVLKILSARTIKCVEMRSKTHLLNFLAPHLLHMYARTYMYLPLAHMQSMTQ